MKPIVRFPVIDRRILLSSLAMLPVRPTPLYGCDGTSAARSIADGATKASAYLTGTNGAAPIYRRCRERVRHKRTGYKLRMPNCATEAFVWRPSHYVRKWID